MTPSKPTPRKNTKQAELADMLRRPEGATLEEMTASTGWKPGSVRAAIHSALKARMGIEVTSEIEAARGRVYRAATGNAEQ